MLVLTNRLLQDKVLAVLTVTAKAYKNKESSSTLPTPHAAHGQIPRPSIIQEFFVEAWHLTTVVSHSPNPTHLRQPEHNVALEKMMRLPLPVTVIVLNGPRVLLSTPSLTLQSTKMTGSRVSKVLGGSPLRMVTRVSSVPELVMEKRSK